MPLMEFGLRSGIGSQPLVRDNTHLLLQEYSIKKQAQAENEARAKLFADDFDYNNAVNAYDNPRIKQFAQGKIKEIGTFIRQNPDWQTNIQKRIQYKQMIRELKDNPLLNQGLASDAGLKELNKALAEKSQHPELMDQQAWNDIAQQRDNYLKYGHQLGEDAAKKSGSQAFSFVMPKDFTDLDKHAGEYGKTFGDFEVQDVKGGLPGAWKEAPKADSFRAVTDNFYSNNKRQLETQARQRGYNNGYDYAQALMKANIRGRSSHGDINAAIKLRKMNGAGKGVAVDNYNEFVKRNEGEAPVGLLYKAFGEYPKFNLRDDVGNNIIPMVGTPVKYTGAHRNIDGKKNLEFYTDIPLDKAEELGMVNTHLVGADELNKNWTENARIKTVTDKKGKEQKVVRYVGYNPVDVNSPSIAGIWNKNSSIAKNNPSEGEDYTEGGDHPPMEQDGFTYTWNPSTGKYE